MPAHPGALLTLKVLMHVHSSVFLYIAGGQIMLTKLSKAWCLPIVCAREH